MKRVSCVESAFGLGVAEHVGGDPLADVRGGPDAVDRFLHLAVSSSVGLWSRTSYRSRLKRRLSTIDRTPYGPSYSLSAAM